MRPGEILYDGPSLELLRRELLAKPLVQFHKSAIAAVKPSLKKIPGWRLILGRDLIFDESGLRLLIDALAEAKGDRVKFQLLCDPMTFRDFYSLGRDRSEMILLPVTAIRNGGNPQNLVMADVQLPRGNEYIPFPMGLCEPHDISVPMAVLMPYRNPFDLLFANQIAYPCELRRRVPHSLSAWAGIFTKRFAPNLSRRLALGMKSIHHRAEVHPTAVIEGSVIEEGARIGAHCVVRFSHIGKHARLHDGAKVEFSTVGERSWLMHDLVIYRCAVEREVFLIHGPYQFSAFHAASSAFATVMMDFLPDGRPITVHWDQRKWKYQGRFLGAILMEGAKTLGGTSTAPGIILGENTWAADKPENIHRTPRNNFTGGEAPQWVFPEPPQLKTREEAHVRDEQVIQ